ncbi:amino acid permease [Candidatus Woesearchaeota archaeon]|nr:amino acid permease [Candidatus Woesearchaeota archaeon]
MFKKRGQPKKYTGFFANKKLLIAITTLMGTIIGAGMLGIPYVVAKAGLLYGLLLIIILGLAFLFINLFVGEIVLRTKGQHQLTGYAEKYLGPTGKRIVGVSLFISLYGALTAYLIGEGATMYAIFPVGSPIIYTIIFFCLAAFIISRGIKATGKAELYLITLLIIVVIALGLFSYDKIKSNNLTTFNPLFLFLPYGVILFATLGFTAIPELQEELGKDKHLLKKALIIGSIIPILIYLVFTFIVVGIVGAENFSVLTPNERIATIALSIYSHPLLGIFANLLAILAMFTSFLALGTVLLDIYELDFHLSKKYALLLTFSIPLLITLLNITSFISILGLTGTLAGGLEGIIIILMYHRAKKRSNRKPEYNLRHYNLLSYLLIVLFILGILYEATKLFFLK